MNALKGILAATIVANHLIVPEAHVQILALLFGSLQAPNHTRVHQVTTHLNIDHFFVRARFATVRKL